MNKKAIIAIAAALLTAAGGYYYYTTTVGYAIGRIKQACLNQDFQDFAGYGIAHIKGQTRELTADELEMISEFSAAAGDQADCPFERGGEVTKEKMTAADLQKYGVPDGYLLTFAGLDRPMKVVKFNGKWRPLVIEFDFDLNQPMLQSSPEPGFSVPPNSAVPGGEMQVEINNGAPAPQPY